MRTRGSTLAALAAVALFAGACGDDNSGVTADSAVGTDSTAAPTTEAPTTDAPTTTAAPTTAPPTTEAPATTAVETTVAGPTAAEQALDQFLQQVEEIMKTAGVAWPAIDDLRASGAPDAPKEVWESADLIASGFYGLSDLIPSGLDPEVRAGAVRVLFDVGNHVAPFIFAPGFDLTNWDPAWDEARTRGSDAVPGDVQALVDLARKLPDVRDVAAESEEAATDTALSIVVVRSFGHSLTPDPFPFSVKWLGELPPAEPGADVPFCANVAFSGGFTGAFTEGVGGCAILYYDTADPSAHDAELNAFLADPTNAPFPPGEIITVVWDVSAGGFVAYGSAE